MVTSNLLPSLSRDSFVRFRNLPATARPAPDSSDTDDREMSDLDNTVNDISSPHASMTRTRLTQSSSAIGSYIVWWRRSWVARHKAMPVLEKSGTGSPIASSPRYFRAFHKRESSDTRIKCGIQLRPRWRCYWVWNALPSSRIQYQSWFLLAIP